MKRADDFAVRRQHIANLTDEELYAKFWELTDKVVDPLLELVDKNEMAMSAGVELSYLGTKHQAEIYKVIESESPPSIAQASKLRKCAEEGVLDDKMIESILSSEKEEKVKLVIYEDKLRRYFPKNYTKEQIEDTVMKLIQKWHKNREKENER